MVVVGGPWRARRSVPRWPARGEHVELLANVPVGTGTDLEVHGDHVFVGSDEEGLVVVDVSDPYRPERVGRFACFGKYPDVAISADGRYGALGIDTPENGCHPGEQGTVVLDLSQPSDPREVAWIPLPRGSHTVTIAGRYLFSNQFDTAVHRLEIHELRQGRVIKAGSIDYGVNGSGPHDTSVRETPDGRRLLYAASIDRTDVFDITDPGHPELLQRIADPAIGSSHQAEANHNGSLLLVSDEYSFGARFPACGRLTDSFPALGLRAPFTALGPEPGTPPVSPADAGDSAGLHFYALGADGTVPGNVDGKVGTFNLPLLVQPPRADAASTRSPRRPRRTGS
jgi:hypothetical protein